MNDFVKRNFVLVLGISLPLMLVALLLLLHGISRISAAAPAYPVLFASFDNPYGQRMFDFDIDAAGRLEIGLLLPENQMATIRRLGNETTLVLFDAREDRLSTFVVDGPDNPPRGERVGIEVPEALAALEFSAQAVAPDGYRLELSAYRGSGLLREIFGTRSGSRHHRLVNDGVSFRVPDVGGRDYGHHDAFVGWVIGRHE